MYICSVTKTYIMKKVATYKQAKSDKSLRTKENAPFGGWKHFEYMEAKEAAKSLAFDNRFNFMNNVKLKSTNEVFNILLKGLTKTEELYSMDSILSMEVVEKARYEFKSEIETIGYDEFLERAYPKVMVEVRAIQARFKAGVGFGVLLSTYSKQQLIKLF